MIVFRVDSSQNIGFGHLMRCLILAKKLAKSTKNVFICRNFLGNGSGLITKNGFELYSLGRFLLLKSDELYLTDHDIQIDAIETIHILERLGEIDCLIVDHYGLSYKWEKKVRPYVKKLMVIDDLANSSHFCDGLLSEDYFHHALEKYKKFTPVGCKLFLGPEFCLLRDEFINAKRRLVSADRKKKNSILVTFGGSDPTNETEKVIKALQNIKDRNLHVYVVVGAGYANKKMIKEACERDTRMEYCYQIDYMADLLTKVDFVIGAVGMSIWERCYLRVPSIVIAVAENQSSYVKALNDPNLFLYIGESFEITVQYLKVLLEEILSGTLSLNNIDEAYNKYFSHGLRMNELVAYIMEGNR